MNLISDRILPRLIPDIEILPWRRTHVLAAGNGHSSQEIATVIGLTTRATRSRLLKLVDLGLAREIRTSPQDPRRRYFRAG